MNEWIYHSCFTSHTDSLDGSVEVTEETFGLKDVFVNILSGIYTRARDNGGLITADWIYILLQQHLPSLIRHLNLKFPTGETFHTGHINITRISSNLDYLEVRICAIRWYFIILFSASSGEFYKKPNSTKLVEMASVISFWSRTPPIPFPRQSSAE